MKKQIDQLVTGILTSLARPAPADPYLALVLSVSGFDGVGLATRQRMVLQRWALELFPLDDRDYAVKCLDNLPVF